MDAVLGYFAHSREYRRGFQFGVASTCVAWAVLLTPMAIGLACGMLERACNTPGMGWSEEWVQLVTRVMPLVGMTSMPLAGLVLGGLGIAMGKRESECPVVGVMFNLSALACVMWTVMKP